MILSNPPKVVTPQRLYPVVQIGTLMSLTSIERVILCSLCVQIVTLTLTLNLTLGKPQGSYIATLNLTLTPTLTLTRTPILTTT